MSEELKQTAGIHDVEPDTMMGRLDRINQLLDEGIAIAKKAGQWPPKDMTEAERIRRLQRSVNDGEDRLNRIEKMAREAQTLRNLPEAARLALQEIQWEAEI